MYPRRVFPSVCVTHLPNPRDRPADGPGPYSTRRVGLAVHIRLCGYRSTSTPSTLTFVTCITVNRSSTKNHPDKNFLLYLPSQSKGVGCLESCFGQRGIVLSDWWRSRGSWPYCQHQLRFLSVGDGTSSDDRPTLKSFYREYLFYTTFSHVEGLGVGTEQGNNRVVECNDSLTDLTSLTSYRFKSESTIQRIYILDSFLFQTISMSTS